MSESGPSRQTLMIGVIVIALGISVVMFIRSRGGTPRTATNVGYFYDLTTGRLFSELKAQVPPIDVPGGAAGKGVRAVVLSCGTCAENDRQIGYLETYTDDARAGLQALKDPATATPQAGLDIQAGTLVARPPDKPGDEPKWVVKTSPAGQQIVQVEMSLCSPNMTRHCTP